MRSFDYSPLFRNTVGFDRMAHMMDSLADEPANSYPPYNIETTGEDEYRITMAVAGFGEDDIDITAHDTQLFIAGRICRDEEGDHKFLHRGIAERAFKRRFNLAEYVVVKKAYLENGLLHVDLVRKVPEEKKPRKIEIITSSATTFEGQAA